MFLLHVTDTTGHTIIVTFATAFARSLAILPLVAQPVTLRCEDRRIA